MGPDVTGAVVHSGALLVSLSTMSVSSAPSTDTTAANILFTKFIHKNQIRVDSAQQPLPLTLQLRTYSTVCPSAVALFYIYQLSAILTISSS